MNPKITSGISTAVIMALVALVLLSFGYDPPDPPIPEEGVEVNIGSSDLGLGDDPKPESTASSYAAPSAQNQVATQLTDPTPAVSATASTGNTTSQTLSERPTVEKREPEINKNALFTGRRNQGTGGGSQGQTGGRGDQGKPNGTETSNNYEGNGGGNGNYSLVGRSSVALPKPEYSSNNQGTVVVQIWVDRDGRVVRAEYQPKGSNTADGNLVGKARAAALKARFNPDASAPEEQKGTITYIFKI